MGEVVAEVVVVVVEIASHAFVSIILYCPFQSSSNSSSRNILSIICFGNIVLTFPK